MAGLRVGFLTNQIGIRGTDNALFDYAHYNEEILGNKSFIFDRHYAESDMLMFNKLNDRFEDGIEHISYLFNRPELYKLDVLYHIQYGNDVGLVQYARQNNIRYATHAVFDATHPFGDRYATISKWMGERYNVPYVPHIVTLPFGWYRSTLREELGIPETAKVFARYGGADTFDIPWVWNAIERVHNSRSDVYFIFMNTDIPERFRGLERVISLPPTSDPVRKGQFIGASNAMLHARQRGETFGMAVAEFALAGKPIITYDQSPERAHLSMLGKYAQRYSNEESLVEILMSWYFNDDWIVGEYLMECSPEEAMKKFKEVFLD